MTRPRNSRIWERDPHDFYVEPNWCDDALFAAESFDGPIFDPACGIGRIVAAGIKAGHLVEGGDIIRRGRFCNVVADFFKDQPLGIPNIVSNPPYKKAREFAEKALQVASRKIALLLPLRWVCGDDRSRWLETTPLARIWFLTPRPSMPPGHMIEAGVKPGGGMQDFCWFVFDHGHKGSWTGDWLREKK